MSTDPVQERPLMLLLDTCRSPAEVAVSAGGRVLESASLEGRTASAHLLASVRELLLRRDLALADLDAIGVISGPGSFTGMRTGLASAMGLSEALAIPLLSVSRLRVLAESTGTAAVFAVIDAGRSEVYVRDPEGREFVATTVALASLAGSSPVVVTEDVLLSQLAGLSATRRAIALVDALPLFLRALRETDRTATPADGNYVREDAAIYSRLATQPAPSKP